MILDTERGQLMLPDNFSFDIDKTNPFFSEEGEQSIPVTLPRSAMNMAVLGYPDRSGYRSSSMRKLSAQIRCGAMIRGGRLVIDTVGQDGIDAAVYLAESDMYSKSKDKSLKDLFADDYRNDFAASADKVAAWAGYLWQVMNGTHTDDFTVFPVFTDFDEENSSIFILNEISESVTTSGACNDLVWRTRTVKNGTENEIVPNGYGLTPFLYLHSLLRIILNKLGYTVTSNCFASGDAAKIVILNNNADTICAGRICLADLMPSCTVGEFITFLQDKFMASVIIDAAAKKARVVKMQDVLSISNGFDVDISSIVDGMPEITFADSAHVRLKSDTSLDGASPAAETIEEMHDKYPALYEVDEDEYRRRRNTLPIMFRKATGQYIKNKVDYATETGVLEEMGSNYFTFERGSADDVVDEKSPGDLMPPIIVWTVGVVSDTNYAKVLGPYVGERINRNTATEGENDEEEQKIILALDGGMASMDTYHTLKYRFGTTQRYNNIGNQWTTKSLVPGDIYDEYWSAYNRIIMGDYASMEAKVDFSEKQLLEFDIVKPKLWKNVRVLCKKLNYCIGRNTVCGPSEFLILRNEGSDGSAPSFQRPTLVWVFHSNILDVVQQYRNMGFAGPFEWVEDEPEYIYMKPPTMAGQISETFYRRMRIKYNDTSTWYYDNATCYLLAASGY